MSLFGPIMGIFSKKIIMDIFHVCVSVCFNYTEQQKKRIFCIFGKVYKLGFKY